MGVMPLPWTSDGSNELKSKELERKDCGSNDSPRLYSYVSIAVC